MKLLFSKIKTTIVAYQMAKMAYLGWFAGEFKRWVLKQIVIILKVGNWRTRQLYSSVNVAESPKSQIAQWKDRLKSVDLPTPIWETIIYLLYV